MIINRLEPSEKIPAELREIYAYLAGNLIDTLHEKLRIDLQKKLNVIKSDAKPMRLYRHKLLGHASLKHHLLPSTELGKDITLYSMKAILERIGEYLETFEGFFTGIVGAEFYYPPSHGEARDLLEYLKLAVEAEEKENEERLRAAMG